MPVIAWAGEPGDRRLIGPSELGAAADQLAGLLRDAEDVAIVLPPVPELVVAMMACERLGVVPRLVHPLDDLRGPVHTVLTSSAFAYRGEMVFLKEAVDDALPDAASVVVHDRTGWMPLGATLDVYHEVPMDPVRDVWFPAVTSTDGEPKTLVEAPSLRGIVEDRTRLVLPGPDETIFLYEGYLEPDDAGRARAAYAGAWGTSRGSRPAGRLS